MKTIIKKSLQSLLFVPVLALGVSVVVPVVQPAEVYAQAPTGGIRGGVDSTGQGTDDANAGIFDAGGIFEQVVNTLLFVIGAIAVIMLIYGGFKYVVSGGDSSAVTSAKNTILYAIIGIIVAILSYAILDFVIDSFGKAN